MTKPCLFFIVDSPITDQAPPVSQSSAYLGFWLALNLTSQDDHLLAKELNQHFAGLDGEVISATTVQSDLRASTVLRLALSHLPTHCTTLLWLKQNESLAVLNDRALGEVTINPAHPMQRLLTKRGNYYFAHAKPF